VPARASAVEGSAIRRLSSAIGRGVVVMTCRGRSPNRSPNCNISNAASAWRHFASSSAQAAWNCGPRRLSGSSAENVSATTPLGHSTRRREGIHCGRSSRRCTASSPETPSTITSRVSCSVSPTSAMRLAVFASASPLTHSAPARVFPAQRPPRMSQVRQSLPSGAASGVRW
jgi:hypothetical protein